MNNTCLIGLAGALPLALAPGMRAETTEERDQRMGWWREARLGMFVHCRGASRRGLEGRRLSFRH